PLVPKATQLLRKLTGIAADIQYPVDSHPSQVMSEDAFGPIVPQQFGVEPRSNRGLRGSIGASGVAPGKLRSGCEWWMSADVVRAAGVIDEQAGHLRDQVAQFVLELRNASSSNAQAHLGAGAQVYGQAQAGATDAHAEASDRLVA